jgi:hypothetical protein
MPPTLKIKRRKQLVYNIFQLNRIIRKSNKQNSP